MSTLSSTPVSVGTPMARRDFSASRLHLLIATVRRTITDAGSGRRVIK